MTWGFPAQRRADEFEALVESGSTGPDATRDADLLELVGSLRAVAPVSARPEFVADLRAALLAEAATALVPADVSKLQLPARRPPRERRFAAVVGGIAAVGVTAGIAVASQGALPGEALYPVKRVIERAHAGLSVGEAGKGATILASASDRLDEADSLARQDDFGDDVRLADTLDTFSDQATEASDLLLADYAHEGNTASIVSLHDFASASLDQLAALEPLVPPEAHDELIRAAHTLQAIDAAATQACPTCGGTPIDSIPPVLAAAEETITVPLEPQPATPVRGTRHHDGPQLPDVQAGDVGPASVSDPSPGSPTGDPGSNPIQGLTDGLASGLGGLTGGGSGGGSGGSSGSGSGAGSGGGTPDVPDVGGTVGGVVDGLGEILGGVLDPLTGQPQ